MNRYPTAQGSQKDHYSLQLRELHCRPSLRLLVEARWGMHSLATFGTHTGYLYRRKKNVPAAFSAGVCFARAVHCSGWQEVRDSAMLTVPVVGVLQHSPRVVLVCRGGAFLPFFFPLMCCDVQKQLHTCRKKIKRKGHRGMDRSQQLWTLGGAAFAGEPEPIVCG